jgi:AAA family ATP:ADP antiporter
MMGMYFLILCALGVLRPVRNALALDAIGGANFYRVYIVSAAVVVVAPLLDRLARRLSWRTLVPGAALTSAAALLFFRGIYTEGSAALGYSFYGFYDVVSAVLVTLFFIAAQLSFDAREARTAYPMIIAAGSVGATVGGAVTGFFIDNLGTQNLLLVSAALIVAFALVLPLGQPASKGRAEPAGLRRAERPSQTGAAELLRDPHIRMIAVTVLIMVLVKQLVDYQFNALTKESFQTLEAVSAFQGKFNAATQWLPFVVLMALRPGMKRWGVALAMFMLPAVMLGATVALAFMWTLWTAVGAKATEMTFRNSAERSAREVLYVPLTDEVKPRAKAYIDATLADGIGKVASVALIGIALTVLDMRQIAFVTPVLCVVWLGLTLALRREYLGALGRSIRGRYASFRGVFASLSDASSGPVLEGALASGDTLQAAFALEIVNQSSPGEIGRFAPQLHGLVGHASADIRERALRVLEKAPDSVDTKRVEVGLTDAEPSVREAAVRALSAADVQGPDAAVRDLLESPDPQVRAATLACLGRGELQLGDPSVARSYLESRWETARRGSVEERLEMALAAGTMTGDASADEYLTALIEDEAPEVAAAALKSAGLLGRHPFYGQMITALGATPTRRAAMEALRRQGDRVVPLLSHHLLDPAEDVMVRQAIPAILSRMPHQATVDALLESFLAPETGQLLDFRTLKALNRLRASGADLDFDLDQVVRSIRREVEAATRYEMALSALQGVDPDHRGVRLLHRSVREAWHDRQEGAFRCLGLLYDPDGIYRCYRALVSTSGATFANALEWLEETVGHARFAELKPVLQREPTAEASRDTVADAFADLWTNNDDSLAYLALWTAADLKFPWLAERVEEFKGTDSWRRRFPLGGFTFGEYALALVDAGSRPDVEDSGRRRTTLDPLEKVFLLQNVDVLRDARTSHFTLLASIAEEVVAEPGTVLMEGGTPPEALYVVIDGIVALEAVDGQVLSAEAGRPFGVWALIDRAPSLVTAKVKGPARLLRVTRNDFQDLLADYPELATELLQGLARKVRALVQ